MKDFFSLWFPKKDEYAQLGGFYQAAFVSELLNIVQPFQFVFLLLVMAKPSWAMIPLMVEGIAVFALEIPTGVVADRWGRKISVVLGDAISGFAWLLVPIALYLDDIPQLLMLCVAFALEGLGQTLVSGAEEAWVVDNLIAARRVDLINTFFAREKSLSSCGGIVSGLGIWLVLSLVEIDASLIAGLWVVAAAGQLLAAFLLLRVPELTISTAERERVEGKQAPGKNFFNGTLAACGKAFLTGKALCAFTAVTLIVSFVTSVNGDAFELSMVTKGLNPKELAPITVGCDVIGFIAPMLVLYLVRYFKIAGILAALLLLIAGSSLIFFALPSLGMVVALYLFYHLIDDLWDPLADVMLHSYIPSSLRATMGSIINQASELLGIAGMAVFTLMLGSEGEELREAIPHLIDAFQGEIADIDEVPLSLFGLPVGDAALVLMSMIGLLAAVVLLVFPWGKTLQEVSAEEFFPEAKKPEPSPVPGALLEAGPEGIKRRTQLLALKDKLDTALDRYNPGEQLTWWVAADAFSVPVATINQLQQIGPALEAFFAAAYKIMHQHPWVLERLEKTFSPHYRLLNACRLARPPRLIRPDVVCDENWVVKLVELEITVGARADTAIMALQYGLSRQQSLLKAFAPMVRELKARGETLALLTAPHQFFEDLPDDALAFAALLREHEGLDNIVVLTQDNLSSLRFDGLKLTLNERFSPPRQIHVIDRFVDIYEIAEQQHAGISAILDAYLAGAIYDINSCCQSLDEKQWLGLFWHEDLTASWQQLLSPLHYQVLCRHLPKTWRVAPELRVRLKSGEEIAIEQLADIKKSVRSFVIKESGTSTTASGAQAFYVLSEMEREEIVELLDEIFVSGVEHVLQELIESPRIDFWALDPESDEVVHQQQARFKLSPFYVDGKLSDIRFVASNQQYAVNDGDCVVGVVRW